jgi:hypothetical protein
MNKFFTFLLISALLLPISSRAEDISTNMVSIGAGYADQVWFSLDDEKVTTKTNSDWDLYFHCGGYDAGIGINGGNTVELYLVKNSDADSFDDPEFADTTGFSADVNEEKWQRVHNSNEKWTVGAFNLGNDGYGDGSGDYGWGYYDPATHFIVGDYMFLIKLPEGDFKKISIDGLQAGKFIFRHANLDGTDEQEVEVKKGDANGRLLAYYSFENGVSYDREPEWAEWDITFHRYIDQIDAGGFFVPYGVTGAKHNQGHLVAVVENGDYETQEKPEVNKFMQSITTIGHSWKEFDMGGMQWIIYSNNIYFIQQEGGDLYKLRFVDFGGSSNGNIYFDQEKYIPNSVKDDDKTLASFLVYPSIIERGEQLTVLYSQNPDIRNADIMVMNSLGKEVASYSNLSNDGLKTIDISNLQLSSGMYFAVMSINGRTAVQKFIVK